MTEQTASSTTSEMNLLRAALMGQSMRAAQKAYFKDRSQNNLKAAKALESAFDNALTEALR